MCNAHPDITDEQRKAMCEARQKVAELYALDHDAYYDFVLELNKAEDAAYFAAVNAAMKPKPKPTNKPKPRPGC
jgi:hypothetical protein